MMSERARMRNFSRSARSLIAVLALAFAAPPLGATAAPADDAKATVQRFVDGMNAGDDRHAR